jgi:hypothetical protein
LKVDRECFGHFTLLTRFIPPRWSPQSLDPDAAFGYFPRSSSNLRRRAFLLTFAGAGLRTNFVDLRRQGLRPLVVGALAEIGIAGATLAMVSAADSTFGL